MEDIRKPVAYPPIRFMDKLRGKAGTGARLKFYLNEARQPYKWANIMALIAIY